MTFAEFCGNKASNGLFQKAFEDCWVKAPVFGTMEDDWMMWIGGGQL